jgi:hypothetical protein
MDLTVLVMTLAMHMYTYETAKCGLNMSKFALNH